jgi:hypothetical protein
MQDAVLTIRCRYCTADGDFLPMRAYKEGRFVCDFCAHTVRLGVANYECLCRNCVQVARLLNKMQSSPRDRPKNS